jgi:peroxiredoxin Q/BCP
MSVLIGDFAPAFNLIDQNGDEFYLKEFIGKERIIIYFYPKDETPGCVAEACGFRDNFDEFANLNSKVIGISKDSVRSHAKFAKHHNLPYVLLSDPKKEVVNLYGVESSLLGLLPGRKTFIIDKKGIVTHIFDYQFKAKQHVTDTLKALSNE